MRILPFLAALLLVAPIARAERLNVLFVLIDDMGYGDLSCFGGMRAQTVAIDRLARDGVRFTQFYVAAPICSPSRVAFTTGQHPLRWRITSFLATRKEDRDRGMPDWLDPSAPSVARFLQAGGYHTAHVGKWHMGGQRDVADAPPISQYGFNTSLTNFEGLGERVLPLFDKGVKHGPTDMSAAVGGGPIHRVERRKVTQVFVDRAIAEIDSAQKQSKPFYINLWLDDVHSPVHDYVEVLTEMDRQLGRVFEHIRSNERLRDNTIILLCSDNGPEQGLGTTGGLRGSKGQLYEGGVRSPLIVWAPSLVPEKKRGTTNDKTMLSATDFAPTVVSLTGVASPGAVFDGMDMSETFIGKTAPNRVKPLIWVRPPDRPGPDNSWPDIALRRGNLKILCKRDGSQPELFDIVKDPTESHNLMAERPDMVERYAGEAIHLIEQITPRQ